MKHSTLLLLVSLMLTSFQKQISAQEMWGMTRNGGESDIGIIFKTDASGNNLYPQYSFIYEEKNPLGSLVQAANGMFYGMTFSGGSSNIGLLFEFDPASGDCVKKVDFNGAEKGSQPYGSLMQAANGKLYGMTYTGGYSNNGVLFEFDPTTGNYVKKIDFNGAEKGRNPRGDLVQAANGMLYGMTAYGGSNDQGVLFEYDPASGEFTKKIDFNGFERGRAPFGGLVQAANGKLYGMTYMGGSNNYGVIFEYDPASGEFTKKIDFNGAEKGSYPYGSLLQAINGKLYGMTSSGGSSFSGVLFEYDPASGEFTKKIDFSSTEKGHQPRGGLLQATNGKLFGMTTYGGSSNNGVLFEYDPASGEFTKKIDFNGAEKGGHPYGSFVQAENGKLYGMTSNGGSSNYGVLFEFDPASGEFTKKIDFNGAEKGSQPYGSLVQAENGKLYGMTNLGGSTNYGVLFEFDLASGDVSKKIDFNGTEKGSYPYGSLLHAANGKLYGMTRTGGSSNCGVLFEFNPLSCDFSKKIDFDGAEKGRYPYGSLVQAANGKLYGMTHSGGSFDCGILFEFDPASGNFSKKIDFNGTEKGGEPYGSLVQASNGKLYGMTRIGGSGNSGVLFEFDPASGDFSKKIDFNGYEKGSQPFGSLVLAENGNLYGMTYSGGSTNYGVLFEFDLASGDFSKKVDFNGTEKGSQPFGSLMQAASGKLYGMTSSGGIYGKGVLFEFDPTSVNFVKKIEFNGTNGYYPLLGHLIEVGSLLLPVAVCQSTSLNLDENGEAVLDESSIDGGSTGNNINFSVDKNSFTCADIGGNTVVLTVTDAIGNTSTCNAVVTVTDAIDPIISCPGNITVENDADCCGAVVPFSASITDNCSAEVAYSINPGTFFPLGSTEVTAAATDQTGNSSSCTFNVIVNNTVPLINGDITAPVDPVAQDVMFDLSAAYTDNNLDKATWYFSPDGSFDIATTIEHAGTVSANSVTASLSLSANVYTVKLEITDLCGKKAEKIHEFIVVYNPDGGFVTGGGWIWSPEGALTNQPELSGKANFGFNAQYKKGKNNVLDLEGNTNFQFTNGNFHFKSSSYDEMTLVISGAKATYRGSGTVNDNGNFGFMVSAIDGQVNGGGGFDKFRIKIWDKNNGNTVVYDNQMNASENADATTELGGGSIVIHEVKNKSGEIDLETNHIGSVEYLPYFIFYPNPFTEKLCIEFVPAKTAQAKIDIYDTSGRLVTTIFNQQVIQDEMYRAEFKPASEISGTYLYRFILGDIVQNGKVIYKK